MVHLPMTPSCGGFWGFSLLNSRRNPGGSVRTIDPSGRYTKRRTCTATWHDPGRTTRDKRTGDCQCFGRRPELFIDHHCRVVRGDYPSDIIVSAKTWDLLRNSAGPQTACPGNFFSREGNGFIFGSVPDSGQLVKLLIKI